MSWSITGSLPPDPYKILGVSKDAQVSEIKSAYRKLVLKCHPDKVQDEALKAAKQEEFGAVQRAYELLIDESSRARSDDQVKLFELKRAIARTVRTVPFQMENPSRYPHTYEARTGEPPGPPPLPPFESGRSNKKDPPRRAYVEEDFYCDLLQFSTGFSGVDVDVEDDNSVSHGPLSSIEEGIKSRNKAYENLRQAAAAQEHPVEGQDSTSPSAKPALDKDTDAKSSTAKVTLTTVPPPQLGITVMNPETIKTSVDIVAVHGLGAIPEITWKEKHSGVNWLADPAMLPMAVPDARIMRFGYDSLWLGKEAIKTKLSTIANKLLLVLNREREVS
jgi:curved DNA-binding protein CbpA